MKKQLGAGIVLCSLIVSSVSAGMVKHERSKINSDLGIQVQKEMQTIIDEHLVELLDMQMARRKLEIRDDSRRKVVEYSLANM
tara:strand:+ start:409 stop:657 length:249 start_codon:yes stop_codon:yes gene_type:complete